MYRPIKLTGQISLIGCFFNEKERKGPVRWLLEGLPNEKETESMSNKIESFLMAARSEIRNIVANAKSAANLWGRRQLFGSLSVQI